jgi:hypothetical protein
MTLAITIGFVATTLFVIWLLCGPKRSNRIQEQEQSNRKQDIQENKATESWGATPSNDRQSEHQAAIDAQRIANKNSGKCQKCWALGVEIAAFAGLCAYAYINFRMWEEMQTQTFEANRAWIAPLIVSLNTTGKVGDTITPGIGYENVGKGPALQMNWQFDDGYVDYPPSGDGRKLQIPVNKTCENLRPDPAGVVEFPFSGLPDSHKTMHVKYGSPIQKIDTAWMENKHWYFVQGCAAYSTMQRTGFTRFCFALEVQRTASGGPRINSDGEPVYSFLACPGDSAN